MWPALIAWAREAMLDADPPLASHEDIDIPQCVANADQAIALLREHHENWQQQVAATRTA
jgi:hypothetical protein